MLFYKLWKNARDGGFDDGFFFNAFLKKSDESELVFFEGKPDEVEQVLQYLLSIPIEEFWKHIPTDASIDCLNSKTIPQYSSLMNCLENTPKVLEFFPDGIGMAELGYQLHRCETESGCIKYGENHADVAYRFGLIRIEKKNTIIYTLSTLGKVLMQYTNAKKNEIYRRMIIRDLFMQVIVSEVYFKDNVLCYSEYAKCLSATTRYRRRTGIFQLTQLEFGNNDLLNRIDWKCPR